MPGEKVVTTSNVGAFCKELETHATFAAVCQTLDEVFCSSWMDDSVRTSISECFLNRLKKGFASEGEESRAWIKDVKSVDIQCFLSSSILMREDYRDELYKGIGELIVEMEDQLDSKTVVELLPSLVFRPPMEREILDQFMPPLRKALEENEFNTSQVGILETFLSKLGDRGLTSLRILKDRDLVDKNKAFENNFVAPFVQYKQKKDPVQPLRTVTSDEEADNRRKDWRLRYE